MSTAAGYAEVAEGVRAAIAAYTQALDDGRTDDVIATFLPEGVSVIPGFGTLTGHDELRAAYAKWVPRRPQRHLVLNTLITQWTADEAHAVSDMVFIQPGDGGWKVVLVGRYRDVVRRDGDAWRFAERVAEFVTLG